MDKFILLNVGAEKAGTTWFYEYIKSRSDFLDIGKELNAIQSTPLLPVRYDNRYQDNLDFYFDKIVSSLIMSDKKFTGDFTHYEGSTPNLFHILKDGFENRNISVIPVYIIRDPIQRSWSAYKMLNHGSDFNPSMSRIQLWLLQEFLACKYVETIKALDKVFDRVYYIFYEELFRDSDNIMKWLCNSLNIKFEPTNSSNKVNASRFFDPVPQEFINLIGLSKRNKLAYEYLGDRFQVLPKEYYI